LSQPLSAVPAAGAPYTFFGTNGVKFGGTEYVPMPIEATGFEWAGTGKLPRPKLRVSNVGGFAGALVIANRDLLGAKVTRIRTFREFLDDGESPDPSGFMEPDIFLVERKSVHRKALIEFELAPAMEQQGLKLPRRIMLRDTCGYTYRQWATDTNNVTGFIPGTCPYAGSTYFKIDDTSTVSADEDVCGYRQTSCALRFGAAANLPFNAFPGISIGGVR
jgi:lambda family phage minor tail protein L